MVFLLGRLSHPLGHRNTLTGTLDGAPYKIRVPDKWNRTLLVYAHGYRDRADHPGETDNHQADAAPGGELGEAFLLAQGYAIAGSAYKNNGWAIEEGIDDTRALTRFFRDRFGKPERTILWGFLFGSLIAFHSIEKFPNLYDGAIPACGIGAGTPRAFDRSIDLSLAYDVTFRWPNAWGSIGDVRDDLDFETEVAPILIAQATHSVTLASSSGSCNSSASFVGTFRIFPGMHELI